MSNGPKDHVKDQNYFIFIKTSSLPKHNNYKLKIIYIKIII
jgi:hypothetical protein